MPTFSKHPPTQQKLIKEHIHTIVVAWRRSPTDALPTSLHPDTDAKNWGIPILGALAKLARSTTKDLDKVASSLVMSVEIRSGLAGGHEHLLLEDVEAAIEEFGSGQETEEKGVETEDSEDEDEEEEEGAAKAKAATSDSDSDDSDDEEKEKIDTAPMAKLRQTLEKTQKEVEKLSASAPRPAPVVAPTTKPSIVDQLAQDAEAVATKDVAVAVAAAAVATERKFKRPGSGRSAALKRLGQSTARPVTTVAPKPSSSRGSFLDALGEVAKYAEQEKVVGEIVDGTVDETVDETVDKVESESASASAPAPAPAPTTPPTPPTSPTSPHTPPSSPSSDTKKRAAPDDDDDDDAAEEPPTTKRRRVCRGAKRGGAKKGRVTEETVWSARRPDLVGRTGARPPVRGL
ncbi:hypothetical protein P280DRAFT_522936 [Massarina eburnea CBS 473.64]|uniref:Uncharacterized protein n=1 Tax=Massarina eburnea CBS 473.64 TaxID=1395130 RepID=A0A6A6RJ98_9PLEO|nr:hypothetical protein P280DRAFT_522936 [Massarina eburnea CBS 473.64]